MSATGERVVVMANQIAANRQREPDPAAATAEHIRAFWDPHMRALFAATDPAVLNATAAAAQALLGRTAA